MNGEYFVKDVYCGKIFNQSNALIGPNVLPDQNVVNCEHTWPQSKFIKDASNQMIERAQLSDLHHLFPADKHANLVRANYDFQDVAENLNLGLDCQSSKSGKSKMNILGTFYFEPPLEHKGNVARAIFYFSTHYNLPVSAHQETVLRRWNKIDPVDENERRRNDKIEVLQGNRNPFIDYPELVDQIEDF